MPKLSLGRIAIMTYCARVLQARGAQSSGFAIVQGFAQRGACEQSRRVEQR